MTTASASPALLSVRAMAAALGISKSQVHRAAAAGMPMTDAEAARAWRAAELDMSRTTDGRIDRPGQADLPTVAGISLAASAGDEADKLADVDARPAAPVDEDTEAYRAARAAREKIRSEREQLELEQLRGRSIDLATANRLAFTAFRSLRDAVLNVPARVKDQCAAMTDALAIEQLLDDELSAVFGGFRSERVLAESEDDEEDDDAAA